MDPAVVNAIENGRSVNGRRWRLRDSSAYEHEDSRIATPLQGIIAHVRGVENESVDKLLDMRLSTHMPDPDVVTDMNIGATVLADAIQNKSQILVFGDYDADGATSTAIVQRYLRMAGHTNFRTLIPNREHGYGFGDAAFEDAMSDMPDLIILLDCGTQNQDTIAKARALATDVIVVDHHKPGDHLPQANALINPHRLDENEEALQLRTLCTAGLAFMLVVSTNRILRDRGHWKVTGEPKISELLDLVALGTVCDVMALTGLNRSFVANGLKRLDRRANVGLAALAQAAGVKEGASVTAFGFHIGPRINAGGRVGTARLGADLLACDDPVTAKEMADTLNRCNGERQDIEKQVQEQALQSVNPSDPIIVVSGQGWHEGVIGIVAGRLKEQFGKPVIVIAEREDGIAKGSGRSITGIDLGAAIMEARTMGFLSAGGGHTMACGLTTTPDQVAPLRAWLIEKLSADIEKAIDEAHTSADAVVRSSDLTHGFIDEIEGMGPYGQGWPKPRFIIGPITSSSINVSKGTHVFFSALDDNGSVQAKAWRAGDGPMLDALTSDKKLLLLGHAEINTFRGANEVNFIVEDAMIFDQ